MKELIACASYTDIGGRPYNEDRTGFRRTDGAHLCAVLADGLGGHGGGEIASEETVKLILSGWQGTAAPGELCGLVQEAHRKVLSLQTPACGMKTTVVVLSVEPGWVRWAHVGDSRLYHFANGALVFQTRDHSVSQAAVMMGQITPEEIRFHEDRSRLFRALGQEGGLSVDVHEEKLSAGLHAFLLCTDGFWEYVYEDEMERELSLASSPQDWLSRLRACHDRRAEERGETNADNHTATAVWLCVE